MNPSKPGKKAAVLGLGLSGFASAVFLHNQGYDLWVSDSGNSEAVQKRADSLKEQGIPVEFGKHSVERILESDWVLISPGIMPSSDIYQAILKKNIPIYSEIEVASWFCPSEHVVAVTGTCGKTTVATLISRVLQTTGRRVITCGNIGNPWIGELAGIQREDFVVLEISSFQLQHCFRFKPHVAVLLNLSANHQDWHADMEEYVEAKLRMFQNQTSKDYAFYRLKDHQDYFPSFKTKALVQNFGGGHFDNPNAEVIHKVAEIFRVASAKIQKVLDEFTGIEHRLENFLTAGGVTYVNDSKSTTTSSLAWALEKFPDKSVVLIAGGHPKSEDFDLIRALVSHKVKKAILIGEARPLLRKAWEGSCPFFETNDFRLAIETAREAAKSGDTVLLSPACASFDMFNNYQERGQLFKRIAQEINSIDPKVPGTFCSTPASTR